MPFDNGLRREQLEKYSVPGGHLIGDKAAWPGSVAFIELVSERVDAYIKYEERSKERQKLVDEVIYHVMEAGGFFYQKNGILQRRLYYIQDAHLIRKRVWDRFSYHRKHKK